MEAVCATMSRNDIVYSAWGHAAVHKRTEEVCYDLLRICRNFGFAFGLSAKTFVGYAFDLYGLKFTESEAQELKNKWFKAYPDIGYYHKMCWKKMKTGKYITTTALGRRICPKLGTDAINAPVQGSVAETMKLAIHYMVQANEHVLDKIVNSVHDSIYLVVPEDEAKYWGKIVEDNMVKAWEAISKTGIMYYKDIPMPVDVVYGHNMTDLSDDFEGGGQALNLAEMKQQLEKNKELEEARESDPARGIRSVKDMKAQMNEHKKEK